MQPLLSRTRRARRAVLFLFLDVIPWSQQDSFPAPLQDVLVPSTHQHLEIGEIKRSPPFHHLNVNQCNIVLSWMLFCDFSGKRRPTSCTFVMMVNTALAQSSLFYCGSIRNVFHLEEQSEFSKQHKMFIMVIVMLLITIPFCLFRFSSIHI